MITRLRTAIASLPPALFHQHGGGWPNESSIALIDAVFSIGAKYTTRNNKGVLDKIRLLRGGLAAPAGWQDSLSMLAAIPPDDFSGIMGGSCVAPNSRRKQTKAEAVIRSAEAMSTRAEVDSASEIRAFIEADRKTNYATLENAYTSVHGLGPVTFRYFLMLLGIPGVKADRMIVRFIEQVTGEKMSPVRAQQLVEETYAYFRDEGACDCTLIEFEHAIWLFQRGR